MSPPEGGSPLGSLRPPFAGMRDWRDERLVYFDVSKASPIFLRRHYTCGHAGKPVLLIHGASAAGDTFLAPRGSSIFDYLLRHGFDPWLLDWRGSFHVAEGSLQLANEPVDTTAREIAETLAFVLSVRDEEARQHQRERPKAISVLGHCVGAAAMSMAIGAGYVDRERHRVDKVLLSTIGLFHRVPWDGWVKVMDRVLERVADDFPATLQISPAKAPWPRPLEDTYSLWPTTWGPPWQEDFFRRLSFQYGQCFLVSKLHPAMTRAAVKHQFGAIPFQLYRHIAQNVLRGFAALCDAEGDLPTTTRNEDIQGVLAEKYLNVAKFTPFEITLLTGALNPLWHRESIDIMGEWLSRDRVRFTKYVLDGYGHQDLWWGLGSSTDVFPLVVRALA